MLVSYIYFDKDQYLNGLLVTESFKNKIVNDLGTAGFITLTQRDSTKWVTFRYTDMTDSGNNIAFVLSDSVTNPFAIAGSFTDVGVGNFYCINVNPAY